MEKPGNATCGHFQCDCVAVFRYLNLPTASAALVGAADQLCLVGLVDFVSRCWPLPVIPKVTGFSCFLAWKWSSGICEVAMLTACLTTLHLFWRFTQLLPLEVPNTCLQKLACGHCLEALLAVEPASASALSLCVNRKLCFCSALGSGAGFS